jgi:putative tricarboxylic transport membrane protein
LNKDLRMAIVLMVLFIVLFGISFTFQSSGVMLTHTTAAFFPRVVLLVAMFLTLILIVQSLRNGPDKAEEKMDKAAFKRVVMSMACAVGLGLGTSYLGTLVSIALFIIAIMLVWGVRSIRAMVLTALLTPVLIYLIFNKILLVQLPSGILV